MGKHTKIEWTHHTFNPWWGCVKVSPACKHCYAESWAKRLGQELWGRKSTRRFFSEKHWSEPMRWNQVASRTGERHRVFCASMADVFENRRELEKQREKLWELVESTQALDWLLLTKRPENIRRMIPWAEPPSNVWIGATVENNHWAKRRIPALLEISASVRFLSCEPLLEKVELEEWLIEGGIHWVIAGGESGAHARAMKPEWVRALRDQCAQNDVAFHFKQWGHWAPVSDGVQSIVPEQKAAMVALGKGNAGRILDGETWDQVPSPKFASALK